MISVSSSLEYNNTINFDFQCENEIRENIYSYSNDQTLLTVIIGAKCSDGIVLIADRKLTANNGEIRYREKIFGDLEHILIGYTGDAQMFDIFRRYNVGDIMIERNELRRYTLDNLLSKVSSSIKVFNQLVSYRPFKVLMVSHREKPLELYHIDVDGKWNKVESGYIAIGSGKEMADMFCGGLEFDKIPMKEFIKHAYLAIMYMNDYCPAYGVGVETKGVPDIRYLYYDQQWDKDPVKDSPQDIEECKNYANTEKLQQIKQGFQKVARSN